LQLKEEEKKEEEEEEEEEEKINNNNNNNNKTESTKRAEKYKCNVFNNSETATNSILTQFYMAFVSQYTKSYISTKHKHCTLHTASLRNNKCTVTTFRCTL